MEGDADLKEWKDLEGGEGAVGEGIGPIDPNAQSVNVGVKMWKHKRKGDL